MRLRSASKCRKNSCGTRLNMRRSPKMFKPSAGVNNTAFFPGFHSWIWARSGLLDLLTILKISYRKYLWFICRFRFTGWEGGTPCEFYQFSAVQLRPVTVRVPCEYSINSCKNNNVILTPPSHARTIQVSSSCLVDHHAEVTTIYFQLSHPYDKLMGG